MRFTIEGADTLTLEELLGIARPAWHLRAACRGKGTALWFPERGIPAKPAKAICYICPVQAECAAAGAGELHGIWGGTSGLDRRAARHGYAA